MYKALEPIWKDGKVLICKGDELTKKQYKALSGVQRRLCENLDGLPAIDYPKGERLGELRNDSKWGSKGDFDSLKKPQYKQKVSEYRSASSMPPLEGLESKPEDYGVKGNWRDNIGGVKIKVASSEQSFVAWDSSKNLFNEGDNLRFNSKDVYDSLQKSVHIQKKEAEQSLQDYAANSLEENEDLNEEEKEELNQYLKEQNDVKDEIVEKRDKRTTTGRYTHPYWSPSLSPNQTYDPQGRAIL